MVFVKILLCLRYRKEVGVVGKYVEGRVVEAFRFYRRWLLIGVSWELREGWSRAGI